MTTAPPSSAAAAPVATPEQPRLTAKTFTLNVLNGTALGIVIALIPGALLGELFKALLPVFPAGQTVIEYTNLSNAALSLVVGFLIAFMFKLTPIQMASVAVASFVGSGVVVIADDKTMVLAGTGNIINVMITAAIAVGVVLVLGRPWMRAYAMIVIPPVTLIVAGGLGQLALPYVQLTTTWLGSIVEYATTLQPIVMGIFLAVLFCIMIVTPISTVAIATAISLAGVGSGVANLGIVAAGFGLAIAGWSVNSLGTSLAVFIGSPKVQMTNALSRPRMMLPVVCNAAVLGVLGALFDIQGTPQSAGFGISGLVGPVNALNLADGGWSAGNIITVALIFIAAPIGLGLFFSWLFTKVIPVVKPEDYLLTFN